MNRVQQYIWEQDLLKNYKNTRNGMVGADYSSKFSIWLANGCISPRYIYQEVKKYEKERIKNDSTYWIIFELLWRDYFKFVAIKYKNKLFYKNGIQGLDINWNQEINYFELWKNGKTGYPLVDANMRELNSTGFMSNRGRQNVASFLNKNMWVDWRMGAEYFESILLDYDPESNYGNWQYSAGIGNDGRQFRVFNITKQSNDYDPEGIYIKLWIPELKNVPKNKLFEPWKLNKEEQKEYGVIIGKDYPEPILDYFETMSCSFSGEFKALEKSFIDELSEHLSPIPLASNAYIYKYTQGHKLIDLPRGGYIIKTSVGNIQYGIPPETIKDSITLKLDVPTNFIIPSKRFDIIANLNVAEFEFPAYYNYFIHKKKINLICDIETKECIRNAFQETLCGPISHENLAEDFYYTYPVSGYPDFKKERKILSGAIHDSQYDSNVDSLLSFQVFENNKIILKEDDNIVEIQKYREQNSNSFYFKFIDNGQTVANILDELDVFQGFKVKIAEEFYKVDDVCQEQKQQTIQQQINPQIKKITDIVQSSSLEKRGSKFNIPINIEARNTFRPPDFGVTVLGNSHGFDPCGHTTGFVLWIYGKGIMVDPPPFSNDYLKNMNIMPQTISAVIITHCHADHDSGAFEKILLQSKIEVITTRTIMNSFVRKYSNITAMSEEKIKKLFVFRPVIIGSSMKINGGLFNFFYSFHVIPCIGFDVEVMGKSIYFSADTFYDPIRLKKYFEWGYLQKERYSQLALINFDKYDLILHEAGVPPIHTPLSSFKHLSQQARENLYILHIAEKDLKNQEGFKTMKEGIENTIVIYQRNTNQQIDHLKTLDLISNIDIFSSLTVKNVRYLLDCLQIEKYDKGELIFPENSTGNKFYVIKSGLVKCFSKSNQNFESFIGPGDYFGEISLIDEMKQRKASAKAEKKTTLLSLERHDFQFLFSEGSNILNKLKKLTQARKQFVIVYVEKNNFLNSLDKNQKVSLEAIIKEKQVQKDECIWKQGQIPNLVVIIKSGKLLFIKQDNLAKICDSGEFIGESLCIIKKQPAVTSLKAIKDIQSNQIIINDEDPLVCSCLIEEPTTLCF
ncbi:hypothetical protein IMG5_108280 [Ichthyophthirius multifiliis]|uniref:Cyclic nucleotide-binding domain-containing protein n=1 Tax=Ichthyophthirius multifiliis TaxID=5932 RepID=G0QTG6_ICHMU|nr:hypothetical protein IMG5_108280 [Ichthyophthirius multifiliis]EGR31487.1 hypothetical protein IMG5_108280 [Ichthyophthirius multifiliis]|eukprot:XP_004034973.1 hypothetical protein IMG5_108280 [Ichthyophthirius multifiliis]